MKQADSNWLHHDWLWVSAGVLAVIAVVTMVVTADELTLGIAALVLEDHLQTAAAISLLVLASSLGGPSYFASRG